MPTAASRYRYAQSMETWIFWGCAALAVVGALATVGQPRPARAFAVMPLPVGAVAALCVVLNAPLVAAALVVLGLALTGVGWWVATSLGVLQERSSPAVIDSAGGARRFGVTLVALLMLELAWVFRHIRGASLREVDAPPMGLSAMTVTAVADHATTALLLVVLLVAIGAGALLLTRRDPI